MPGITRFEEIQAWQTGRELTNAVYKLTNQSEFSRDFGLRDQIRRAVVSVMSNVAEGFEIRTDVQFINYLGLARASTGEARAQLYIALDQGYICEEKFKETYALTEKCARQVARFISYLESNPRPRRVGEGSAEYHNEA
ncbi:MAG TPA: four helix bundle protein [Anaerolineales bacterium]